MTERGWQAAAWRSVSGPEERFQTVSLTNETHGSTDISAEQADAPAATQGSQKESPDALS